MPPTISARALRCCNSFAASSTVAENPAAVGHDTAGPYDQGEFQTIQGNGAVTTVVDAIDHKGVAMLMRRCFLWVRVNARTEIVAVAAFHVLAA